MKHEAIFTCKVELVLNVPPGSPPSLEEVNYDLRLPKPGPLNESIYLDAEKMPTGAGIKIISNALIQALAANVKAADSMSLWKPEEHIEWIFNEINRALNAGGKHIPGTNHFKTSG